jgi:hypothetical protein
MSWKVAPAMLSAVAVGANQDRGTQSARNCMQPYAKSQAPNGDTWDGYASLMVQGNMIAGPVAWHPNQGDFGGTPVTEAVINSGASIFDCADGA